MFERITKTIYKVIYHINFWMHHYRRISQKKCFLNSQIICLSNCNASAILSPEAIFKEIAEKMLKRITDLIVQEITEESLTFFAFWEGPLSTVVEPPTNQRDIMFPRLARNAILKPLENRNSSFSSFHGRNLEKDVKKQRLIVVNVTCTLIKKWLTVPWNFSLWGKIVSKSSSNILEMHKVSADKIVFQS